MDIVTAARKRLVKNTKRDQTSRERHVQFTRDGVRYYKPGLFHLSWTMDTENGRVVNMCLKDIRQCKKVVNIYLNGVGRYFYESETVRMLGNWPVQRVRVVGTVMNAQYIDDDRSRMLISIDDGTCEDACLNVFTGRVDVRVGMIVEIVGKLDRDNSLGDCERVKKVWLNDQIAWWHDMLNDRTILQEEWVLEETCSFSTEVKLLREHEQSEQSKQNENMIVDQLSSVEIIDLERPEMKILLSSGNMVTFDTWVDSLDITNSNTVLQTRLVYEIVLLMETTSVIKFASLYNSFNIRTSLNKTLLTHFVTRATPLTDEGVYLAWSQLRFQESKQVLLSELLHAMGVSADAHGILDVSTLATAIDQVTTQLHRHHKHLHDSPVSLVFPLVFPFVSSVGLVAGLVTTGKVSCDIVCDVREKVWRFLS